MLRIDVVLIGFNVVKAVNESNFNPTESGLSDENVMGDPVFEDSLRTDNNIPDGNEGVQALIRTYGGVVELPDDAESDHQILERMKASDPTALPVLVTRYYTALVGHALRIHPDRCIAQEVANTAFWRLSRRIDAKPEAVDFSTYTTGGLAWLLAVTKNLMYDYLKKERSRTSGSPEYTIADPESREAYSVRPPVRSVEEEVIDALEPKEDETSTKAWQRLELLVAINEVETPRQREILRLYLGGLTVQAIAEEIGVKTSSIDGSLKRALAQLAKIMTYEDGEARLVERTEADAAPSITKVELTPAMLSVVTNARRRQALEGVARGLQIREVAEALGVSESAAKNLIYRGYADIRQRTKYDPKKRAFVVCDRPVKT